MRGCVAAAMDAEAKDRCCACVVDNRHFRTSKFRDVDRVEIGGRLVFRFAIALSFRPTDVPGYVRAIFMNVFVPITVIGASAVRMILQRDRDDLLLVRVMELCPLHTHIFTTFMTQSTPFLPFSTSTRPHGQLFTDGDMITSHGPCALTYTG
jgi:hypothetical protein